MLQRAISGIVFLLVLISSIIYSNLFTLLLFFVFMIIGLYEFQKMVNIKSYSLYLVALITFISSQGFINTMQHTFNIHLQNIKSDLESLQWPILFCYFIYTLFKYKKAPFTFLGKISISFLYVIVPFTLIISIPFVNTSETYNGSTLLGCLILIWCTDTFAYLTGKYFGKNKLYPAISPNKTIEGSAGGFVAAIIAGFILSIFFTQFNALTWIILAIIISVIGSIGDLIESMFKRAVNIKDSGKLMPGHGGVLDRFDSLIFAAPFIYLFLKLIS